MRRVLLIEDQSDIARLVSLHVRDLGCVVDQAESGEQGLELAKGCRYDLVILDLMLPGMDGLTVCRHLRAGECYVPILMLTAKSSELDRVLGLELGADDYLTKPFSIPELLARIKAVFRRVDALSQAPLDAEVDDTLISVGRMRIDPAKYRVTIDERDVSLTRKEFDLLLQFAANPGRVYTRSQLMDLIWGRGHQAYEHTVNSHINRLRAKIEQDPTKPEFILTVWGVGYKFTEAVPPLITRTLFGRLAVGFLLLMALLGALYLGLTLHGSRLYFQEVNQNLNRELARNLIHDYALEIHEGRFNAKAVEGIFHAFMVINPSIEVYLLDADGRILAYEAPPGRVKLERVPLEPIRHFIAAGGSAPVTGPDPRDPEREKVFSAAPIGNTEHPGGYLYVVLAGEQHDSIAATFSASYLLRFVTYGVLASLLLTLLVGLWLLHHVTRRLHRLDRAVTAFRDGGPGHFAAPADLDTGSQDEIGRLGRSFTEMAQRINSQVVALRESDRLRRELLANVSHDLRTPITSVKGYLETLLLKADQLSRDEQREYLEIAIRHSERLGRLVEELFELARLESDQTPLQREKFSLAELVQDVVVKNQIFAESKRVRLHTRVPGDLPFVEADIGLMERAIQNLIDNAMRHTTEGGNIDICLDSKPGSVHVRIADTGEGIPPQDLPYVFDRFYQVRRTEGGA